MNNFYDEYYDWGYDKCCELCDAFDDEFDDEDLEAEIIFEAIEEIFEAMPCPHCVADLIHQLVYKFKKIGWDNCKDTMQSLLDEF